MFNALRELQDFDKIFGNYFDVGFRNNFPPYDIEKIDDTNYKVSVAVAGYNKEQLSVTVKDETLYIKAEKGEEKGPATTWLHSGIARRAFNLAVYIKGCEVTESSLNDGILSISVAKKTPEDENVKSILIK